MRNYLFEGRNLVALSEVEIGTLLDGNPVSGQLEVRSADGSRILRSLRIDFIEDRPENRPRVEYFPPGSTFQGASSYVVLIAQSDVGTINGGDPAFVYSPGKLRADFALVPEDFLKPKTLPSPRSKLKKKE